LGIYGNVYHTYIALRKVIVFAESMPGYEELLYQCLKSNDYWLYVSRCIGAPKCVAIYGIPAGKEKDFEEFINKLKELNQISNVDFLWITCIHNINVTTTWFDKKPEVWRFPWESWLKEAQTCRGELPYTLKEHKDYIQKADWIDIIILKELEKDVRIKLKAIAKMLNMSLQRVKYHYENHVIKEQMFEGYQVVAEHYKGLFPEHCFFTFNFNNHKNLTKFVCSLMNKPFARMMGKAYGKNQLFVHIYLPRAQLTNFTEALSKLIRNGFLETYEYVIQDYNKKERQTISYEYFRNNNWEYNHEKYLENLQATLKKFVAPT
jgi:hypothetical protein